MAQACVEKDWAGSNFSKRIWKNTDRLSERIESGIIDCIVGGKNQDELKRSLRTEFGVSRRQADCIVRSEVMHTLNTAQIDTYKAEGVKQVEFDCEASACEDCLAIAADNPYPIDKIPCVICHPNCRCTWLPVVEELDWDSLKKKYSEKPIEKSAESGIIKIDKATEGLYRQFAELVAEPMPAKQFNKIKERFEAYGGIIQCNADTDIYLKSKNAEAITYNSNTILMKQNPSRAAVFEELIHSAQYRNGDNDGTHLSRLRCEILAQEKLLKYSAAYQLTNAEIEQTQKALRAYKAELEEYIKNGGA